MKFLRIAVILTVMAIAAIVCLQLTGFAQDRQSGTRFEAAASSQREFTPAEKNSLPEAGGALPPLSVIGFGVLLGGIASALKTR
jgi:hypothetical protein